MSMLLTVFLVSMFFCRYQTIASDDIKPREYFMLCIGLSVVIALSITVTIEVVCVLLAVMFVVL